MAYLSESQFPISSIIEFFNELNLVKMKVNEPGLKYQGFENLLRAFDERHLRSIKNLDDVGKGEILEIVKDNEKLRVHIENVNSFEGFKFYVKKDKEENEYSYKEFIAKYHDYYVKYENKYVYYSPDELLSSKFNNLDDKLNVKYRPAYNNSYDMRYEIFSVDKNGDEYFFGRDSYCSSMKKEIFILNYIDNGIETCEDGNLLSNFKITPRSQKRRRPRYDDGSYKYSLMLYYEEYFEKDFLDKRQKHIELEKINRKRKDLFLLDVRMNDHFEHNPYENKYFWNFLSQEFINKITSCLKQKKMNKFEIKDEETALKSEELNKYVDEILYRVDKINEILNKDNPEKDEEEDEDI